eukprot:481966_1
MAIIKDEHFRFMTGDIVQMTYYKKEKKMHRNGKLGNIVGPFVKRSKRWPIRVKNGRNGKDKIKYVKTANLQIVIMEQRLNNYNLGPMAYVCITCNATLFEAEFESGDCYYCKTGTQQTDWEADKHLQNNTIT